MARIPVILDTDIGGDIDDTWALGLLLRCPELDVRLVTSATGNTEYRARLIARILDECGRSDIPIGIGVRRSDGIANQSGWLGSYSLIDYPGEIRTDGVGAMIDAVRTSPEPPVVIAIAPLTNLAAAYARWPGIAARSRVVAMAGCFRTHVEGAPGHLPECNIVSDLAASRAVFASPWPITATPLDSCGRVVLRDRHFAALEASRDPLCRLLLANYDDWNPRHPVGRTTVLFDTVAVHLAISEALLAMADERVAIDDQGRTCIDALGRPVRIAWDWHDLPRFQQWLVDRFTGAASQAVGAGGAGA